MTGYTPDGFVYHIGKNDIQRLCRLNHHKNKLQSKILKCEKHKRRYNLTRAFRTLSEKIKNLVNDCHKKNN